MYHLMYAVMAIVLMSASLGLAANYIPASAIKMQRMHSDAVSGIKSLESSVIRYLDNSRDQDGAYVYAGSNVALLNEISPHFGFIPRGVGGLSWEVATGIVYGEPAIGICLKGEDSSQVELLTAVGSKFPIEATFLAGECNATEDTTEPRALTYWVLLSHHE